MPAPERSASNPPAQDDRGETVVAIPRGDEQELRLTLSEYSGHAYLMLQTWEKGRDGKPYPVRGKGSSIRVREIGQLVTALNQVAKRLGQGPAPRSNPSRPAARPTPAPDDRPGLTGLGNEPLDEDLPF